MAKRQHSTVTVHSDRDISHDRRNLLIGASAIAGAAVAAGVGDAFGADHPDAELRALAKQFTKQASVALDLLNRKEAALPPRGEIEAEIERLIALLDMIDPDPDLEDNADAEYSLGWTEAGPAWSAYYEGEAEPSLGWTASYALGGTDDREGEHDGREPDADDEDNGDREHAMTDDNGIADTYPGAHYCGDLEPSLGWSSIGMQPGPCGIGAQRFSPDGRYISNPLDAGRG